MVRSLVPEGATEAGVGRTTTASGSGLPWPTAPFKQRRHDIQAKTLDITPDELSYIEKLTPLLEHSPRALKRFINVYRLLKASLPPDEESDFFDVLALALDVRRRVLWCSLSAGLHWFSEDLFTIVLAVPISPAARTPEQANLGKLMDVLKCDSDMAFEEFVRAEAWLTTNARDTWQLTDPIMLRPWVRRVSRYSYKLFQGGSEPMVDAYPG
jgi:hypothetical protein